MATQWKCPKEDCPPTDFAPAKATAFGDAGPKSICGGQCGETYPTSAFKRVG